MGDRSGIQWTAVTGRRLGAFKSAAKKCGCSLEEWMRRRASGARWCFRCRQWKDADLFSIDVSRRGGRTSSCKECTSDAFNGVAVHVVDHRTAHIPPEAPAPLRYLRSHRRAVYIDHDHKTGELRGLLCPGCNTAIGHFREDPALFAAALAYLEKHRG